MLSSRLSPSGNAPPDLGFWGVRVERRTVGYGRPVAPSASSKKKRRERCGAESRNHGHPFANKCGRNVLCLTGGAHESGHPPTYTLDASCSAELWDAMGFEPVCLNSCCLQVLCRALSLEVFPVDLFRAMLGKRSAGKTSRGRQVERHDLVLPFARRACLK